MARYRNTRIPIQQSAISLGLIFILGIFLLLEASCQNNGSERWENEFPDVVSRINDGMIAPAAAIIEVSACETLAECLDPIERLPNALAPANVILQKEINLLETLNPPDRQQALHDSYIHTLKLRLETFELYIGGVENKDDALLRVANDAWSRTQNAGLRTQALLLEWLQTEERLNPAETWIAKFGMVTQDFNQNEAAIAPALEAFFYCQTFEECNAAVKNLPTVLRPGQDKIPELLDTLDTLKVPQPFATCSKVQNAVRKSYQLRFEAYNLLIRGSEQLNDNLLNSGLQAWTDSMDVLSEATSNYSDCLQSLRG